jgi:hypothetical protein
MGLFTLPRVNLTGMLKADLSRDGPANLFKSPQIENPQILGLILQLQIRKRLRCDSLQIANLQFL